MTPRFDLCVAFVLAHETEYRTDGSVKVERDPHDPGGTTKFGIDQRSHPDVDVAALSKTQAIELYRADEWEKCRCAQLKQPWDLAVFDTAVNIGKATTIKLVQRAVGAKVDGFIGPQTIAAVARASYDVYDSFLHLREAYYRSLPDRLTGRFLNGWLNRLADVRSATRPAGSIPTGPGAVVV